MITDRPFNITNVDEAIELSEQALSIAAHALEQARAMATVALQVGTQPSARRTRAINEYLLAVEDNQRTVANVQAAIVNTKALRAALSTVPVGTVQ
jgi:hypothetical protein